MHQVDLTGRSLTARSLIYLLIVHFLLCTAASPDMQSYRTLRRVFLSALCALFMFSRVLSEKSLEYVTAMCSERPVSELLTLHLVQSLWFSTSGLSSGSGILVHTHTFQLFYLDPNWPRGTRSNNYMHARTHARTHAHTHAHTFAVVQTVLETCRLIPVSLQQHFSQVSKTTFM